MPDELLSAADVAHYLKVNVETVYRLIRKENLPAIRIGGQWRLREKDVEQWLENRTHLLQAP